MAYIPPNPNGSTTSANSTPVVIASDQTNIPIKAGFSEQAALTAGALNADLVPSTDVSAYKRAILIINSNAYVGTLTFQGSNDNFATAGSTISIMARRMDAGITATSTSGVTQGWSIPIGYRYLRVRMTAYTSGAANGVLELSTLPQDFNYAVTDSSGNTTTNITNLGTGTMGNSDANGAGTFSALVFNDNMVYNGTSWDRERSATSASATTGTGLLGSGILGFDGTNYQRIKTSTAGVPVTSIDQTTVGTTNAVSLAQLGAGTIATGNGTSSTGTLRVAIASDQTTNTNPWLVKQAAQTTGGATPYQLISAATTNATSVKASAGTIYGIQVGNNSTTAIAYLKLYNKASAPTVGTDTPVKTLLIPYSSTGGGSNIPLSDIGIAFGTGIAFAITGGMAVADTTAVAATTVSVSLDYI